MRWNKKPSTKSEKTETIRTPKRGVVGYSRKSALLEEAITQMNAGKYGRSSAALKELLALDPVNMEARRLFATLHLRLGSLIPAREAFDALIAEAFQRQDYWLAESLLREYLAAGPRCVPYLEKLGTIYQEKGNALEAVEEYGKAVDILIEDPDPEHPDHADRLYAKIRELAPASPVAFRLASSFDAQTGELVARHPSALETTTLHPEDSEEGGREQLGHQAVGGAMPWDIQVPSEGLGATAETSQPAERRAEPTVQLENSADALQVGQSSDQDLVLPERVAAAQTEHSGIDAQTDTQTERSIREVGEVSSVEGIARFVEQRSVEDIPPSPGFIDSVAEIPVVPLEVELDVVAVDSGSSQTLKQESAEAPETVPILEGPVASGAMRLDSDQTIDASVSFSAGFAEPRLAHPPQSDEKLPSLSLKPDPSPSESIAVPHKEEASLQTDTVEKLRAEERSIPADTPIAPTQVSTDEIAQPWKQPGFSWKSIFDTAWKLGEQSPAKDVSTPPVSSRENKTVTETPPVPSSQSRLVEDLAREILKPGGEIRERDEEAARSPVTSMPWDHVQESALSIPPAQTNSSIAESIEPFQDPPQDRDRTSQTIDSHLPTAPLANDSDIEPDSFVLAQEAPIMPSAEEHDAVAVTSAPPTTAKNTDQVAESEPAFSFVKSSPIDEATSLVSPTPEPQPSTQEPSIGSLVDQVEDHGEPVEVLVEREQARAGAATEEVRQGSKAELQSHHLQPVDEVITEKTETVPSLDTVSIERSTTEPIVNNRGVLSERLGTSQAVRDDEKPTEVVNVHTSSPITEPVAPPKEWAESSVSTRASRDYSASCATPAEPAIPERQDVSQPLPAAHIADAAFSETSRLRRVSETSIRIEEAKQKQASRAVLSGLGTAITGFLSTCFSTTQAIVRTVFGLVALVGLCIVLGMGALAVTWMIMEEPPSPTFQSFTTTPQQTLSGAQKNAYTVLFGIDAPVGQDPLRVGIGRQPVVGNSTTALDCAGNPGAESGDRSSASANTMRGWVRGSDPIGQFKSNQDAIQGWGRQQHVTLERYRQWQTLPFEDWGYGQPVSPPCGAMVFAHQLHVADGFGQGADVAVDRLETDMDAWRVVLGQARTLPMKMLALQAINDDIAVASGLLVRSDLDTKYLGRITKLVRPLDQGELSLRWPMQSELVSAAKTYESQLKAARAEGQSMSAMVVSALPLPKQRRLNDYAKYYETSYQATGEKQYGSLPKRKDHVRFPAAGVTDYLTNPIENLVGVEPLPAWDVYNGMIVDTDAHLRLASLQAWLRRGSSDGDLPSKIAKAGQDFYDPYTGLPMLVNQKKGLLYSVGHDGKDQDADSQADVVVEIPFASTSASQTKSSVSSSKSR
ncbi:MAG: hypothetical protein U0223_06955 [Nitrospira sp.]|nr:tetratricopeptide repeat protein [Nitrospira sp.]